MNTGAFVFLALSVFYLYALPAIFPSAAEVDTTSACYWDSDLGFRFIACGADVPYAGQLQASLNLPLWGATIIFVPFLIPLMPAWEAFAAICLLALGAAPPVTLALQLLGKSPSPEIREWFKKLAAASFLFGLALTTVIWTLRTIIFPN